MHEQTHLDAKLMSPSHLRTGMSDLQLDYWPDGKGLEVSSSLRQKYPELFEQITKGYVRNKSLQVAKFDVDIHGREMRKLIKDGKTLTRALLELIKEIRSSLKIFAEYVRKNPGTEFGRIRYVYGASRLASIGDENIRKLLPGFEVFQFDEPYYDVFSHGNASAAYRAVGLSREAAFELSRSKSLAIAVITSENLLKYY